MDKLLKQFYSNDYSPNKYMNRNLDYYSNKNILSNSALNKNVYSKNKTNSQFELNSSRPVDITMGNSGQLSRDASGIRKNFIDSINKNMFNSPRMVTKKTFIDLFPNEVMGINPLDEKQKKLQQDISTAEELSDNIELFKLEMTNQMMKLQRGQSKLKVGDLKEELSEFKDTFKKTIEKTNKKRDEEISGLSNDMKNINNVIQEKITQDTSKNKKEYIDLKSEVKLYKEQLNSQLEQLEKKQKMQIEQVRQLMINSSDEKLRKLADQYIVGGESDNTTVAYVKPRKSVIGNIIEDLNIRKQRSDKRRNRKSTTKQHEDILKFITKKKQIIMEVDDELKTENSDEDNIEDFKKNKLSDISENVKYKNKEEFKRIFPILNQKLHKFGTRNFEMKKINKLRSYVYAVLSQIKFKNFRKEMIRRVKISSLKYFSDNYKNGEIKIRNWIVASTKVAYASVKNFEQLELDFTKYKTLSRSVSTTEIKEKFIKLEIRLNSFLDELIENLNENALDLNTLAFLKLIITSDNLIPYKFFTLFELQRLDLNCGEIINLETKQRSMIICIFIIIKIMIKQFLMNTSEIKNTNVKRNFKMIASCYYHTIIEYFNSNCKLISDIKDVNEIVNIQATSDYSKQSYDELNYSKHVDRRYIMAVNRVAKKKATATSETNAIFSSINQILKPFIPDEDSNGIQSISMTLFQLNEMDFYFKTAKQNNFDLMGKILEFSNKLIKLILNNNKRERVKK